MTATSANDLRTAIARSTSQDVQVRIECAADLNVTEVLRGIADSDGMGYDWTDGGRDDSGRETVDAWAWDASGERDAETVWRLSIVITD